MSLQRITQSYCRPAGRGRQGLLRPVVLSVSASLLVLCSQEYNPFSDFSNAGAVIEARTVHEGDTLSMFTTYSISVKVAVKELVDSFTVSASGNRLWDGDSTIRASSFPDEPFSFTFSFNDTGRQWLALSVARTDGQAVRDTTFVVVRSPLKQDSLAGLLGDSVVLRTPPVGDRDVNYFWSFGAGTVYSSQRCSTRVVPSTPLLNGRGGIWVSDGIFASPADSFTFELRDTVRPEILCVNEGYVGRDTVYTGDSVFSFKVRITDRSGFWVDSASIDGERFDMASDRVYTKFLDRIYLNGPGNPRVIDVYAVDHFANGNEAVKRFWVVFNDTVPRTVPAEIVILAPPLDSSSTGMPQVTVVGTVVNHSLPVLDLTLSLLRNGVRDTSTRTVTGSSQSWEWTVPLDTGDNRIEIEAADRVSRQVIDRASRSIRYVPGVPDTLPPQILRVAIDGVVAQNLYTERAQVVVEVEAVDNHSGIESLFVNGIPRPAAGRWYYDTLAIQHLLSGNEVLVRAVDSSGNDSVTTVVVYSNKKPRVESWASPAVISSDSLYQDTIVAFDPDHDSITFSKWQGPASLSVWSDGTIAWGPQPADTGTHQVVVRVFDGYEPVFQTFSIVVYSPGSQPPGPLALGTTQADLPAFLEVGTDTLSLVLRAAAHTGVPPFRFYARTLSSGKVLLPWGTDSLVRWAPDSSDLGSVQLMLAIRDQLPSGDTLYARVLVVPSNRPCSLTVVTGCDTLPNGALNVNGKQGPDTLRYRLRDPDDQAVEIHDITISQWRTRLVNHMDSAKVDSFELAIDPSILDGYDTITVTAVDRAGHVATLKTALYYGMPPYSPQAVAPQNYATVSGTSTTLTWQSSDPDGDSIWYDVYMGTNSQNLPKVGTVRTLSYPVSNLTRPATYYWRVVARDWKSITTGNVWQFQTQ